MRGEAEYLEPAAHMRARRALYVHATVYGFVNAMLFALDASTPGEWWFFWPLLGWGIGLASHAAAVRGGRAGLSGVRASRVIRRSRGQHRSG